MNRTNDTSFTLRRSAQPYIGLSVILFLVMIVWTPYMFRTHDWSPLEGMAILVGFLAVFVLFGISYRIWWRDDAVVRRTAGIRGVYTTIKVEDIESVAQETSDLHTLVKLNRPFRRITIYGKTSDGLAKIDVSLKHFNLDDVRRLMRVIHEHRPDLTIPERWI